MLIKYNNIKGRILCIFSHLVPLLINSIVVLSRENLQYSVSVARAAMADGGSFTGYLSRLISDLINSMQSNTCE